MLKWLLLCLLFASCAHAPAPRPLPGPAPESGQEQPARERFFGDEECPFMDDYCRERLIFET